MSEKSGEIPQRNADDISFLVNQQLQSITQPEIRNIFSEILITPTLHLRKKENGAGVEKCPCWTIALAPEKNCSFLYTDFGITPEQCWGLGIIAEDEDDKYIHPYGYSASWWESLQEAFENSPFVPQDEVSEEEIIAGLQKLKRFVDLLKSLAAEFNIDKSLLISLCLVGSWMPNNLSEMQKQHIETILTERVTAFLVAEGIEITKTGWQDWQE